MTALRASSVLLLAITSVLGGCGSTPGRPAVPVASGAYVAATPPVAPALPAAPPPGAPSYPLPAVPPGLAGVASSLLAALESMPCPPPGVPAEIAAALDCDATRRIEGAASYVARPLAPGSLPPAVDLRARGLSGPVKDQGQVGACAGFALSSVLDNATRRSGRGDVAAPLHVFARYTGKGLRTLAGQTITAEPVWPYDPKRACLLSSPGQAEDCGATYGVVAGSGRADPRLWVERARADASGVLRVDGFEEMPAGKIDLDQIASLIAAGESVWASLAFHRPSWRGTSVRSGYIPYYPANTASGGHAVTTEGYRPGPFGREFLLHNSWGPDWGEGGFAWMPESMLSTHLLYAYRVRASATSGAPAVALPDVALPPGLLPAGIAWPFLAPSAAGAGSWPSLQLPNMPAAPANGSAFPMPAFDPARLPRWPGT